MTSRTATTDRTDAAFDLLDRCDGDLGIAVRSLLDVLEIEVSTVAPIQGYEVDIFGLSETVNVYAHSDDLCDVAILTADDAITPALITILRAAIARRS